MHYALLLIIGIFCVGYLAIALEHQIKIDKAASAILTAVFCWLVYILFAPELVNIGELPELFLLQHTDKTTAELAFEWVGHPEILRFLGEISGILFFLLGAMTIVELIGAYEGFSIITDRIKATQTVSLLWIIGFITFFLSAVLDNLTTSIVMVLLIHKLIEHNKDRMFFAGIIVIAANAGGAWSPIGDVTTTMLWIGGQITSLNIIKTLILPSLACLMLPLLYLSWRLRRQTIVAPTKINEQTKLAINPLHKRIIFFVGIGGLLFVPIFKTLTHLPPFMGMLFSLGVLWLVSELLNNDKDEAMQQGLHIVSVLKRIDTPSILFFLGILMAVSVLESTGILIQMAQFLDQKLENIHLIVFMIGLFSAIVDNVPLVAAAIGMYDLQTYPTDHSMWEFLAYAAGTGGSCLIIGSAAGIVVMGMERINFFWYLRHMSFLALLGYVAGALTYLYTYHWFI